MFRKQNVNGMIVYSSSRISDYKINEISNRYFVCCKSNGKWKYVSSSFDNLEDAEIFVSDESCKLTNQDINLIKKMYGFSETTNNRSDHRSLYFDTNSKNGTYQIRLSVEANGEFQLELFHNYKNISISDNITKDELIYEIDTFLNESNINPIQYIICNKSYRSAILCGKSSKELARDLVRVKSSNVWAYHLNIKDAKDKTGDLIVQFKNKNGGPGDVYMYFDVPIILYRKWHSAPSKGHFFWQYIRNDFKYRKLTGDRKGKLKNAVN